MHAERGSKATAADVTKAIIIVRKMLIPLGHPPRDSPSRENIPTGFAPLCATTASRRSRFLAGRCLVAGSCACTRFEANPFEAGMNLGAAGSVFPVVPDVERQIVVGER